MTDAKSEKEEKPASRTKDVSAAKAPSSARQFDIVAVLAGAALGAVIALGLQLALTIGGIWPGPGAPDLSSLEGRVAALERAAPASGPNGAPAAEITRLSQEIAQVRERIGRIEARPAGGNTTDLGSLNQSIENLRTELNAVEASMASLDERTPPDLEDQIARLASRERVNDLDARVTKLEEDAVGSDARKAAMALGLAQLARAAHDAEPFGNELAAVEVLRPDDPLLGRIAPFAEIGVPSEAQLRTDFPAVARAVAHAAQTPAELTAWGRVWVWLGQYISFRRTGDTEGESANAILARAEERLGEGDLRAALNEMNALPEQAKMPATAWIEGAEARVALDRLTTELSAEIIAELGR